MHSRVPIAAVAAAGTLAAVVVFSIVALPPAGEDTPPTPEQLEAAIEAHRGDFDYLLGDWRYDADSREWGKYHGYWSAVALAEGQILDEYRVAGENGETLYVTTTFRAYNAFADRWELIGTDGGGGLQDFGTARKVGDEMHIEQTFGVARGAPSILRIRYYDIRPDRFSWRADRSTDGGETWDEDHLRIEAERIGPARRLEPLAKVPAAAPPPSG